MGFKLTAYGRKFAIDRFTNQRTTWPGMICRVYKNNLTPTGAEGNSDYIEGDFTGNAGVTISAWGAAVDDGTTANSVGPLCLFIGGGPFVTANDLYGYYIVDTSTGDVIGGERFATSFAMNAFGRVLPIVPSFGGSDL